MNDYIVHLIFLIAITITMISRNKHATIYKDLMDPLFIIFTVMIIIFLYMGLNSTDPKINKSTHRAIVAFLIAYMAHADLIFIVPIVIFIITYHIETE